MIARLARWAVQHRGTVIAGWCAAVGLSIPGALTLQGVLAGGSDGVPGSPSVRAIERAVHLGMPAGAFFPFLIVLQSDGVSVDDARFAAAAGSLATALTRSPGRGEVRSYWNTGRWDLLGRDHRTALVLFQADVDAQGGAYATGVLVLMSSAALAVTLAAYKSGRWWQAYLLITLVFAYTTAQNIHERPEGIRIAAIFIASIIVMSLVSRVLRSTELRIHGVDADEAAELFIDQAATTGQVRVIANRPGVGDVAEYAAKIREARDTHQLKPWEPVLFVEVATSDASEFSNVLKVRGVEIGPFRVLRCLSAAVPNAIAGLLLHIRDRTGKVPHAYFGWTEGNPIAYLLKFLAFGEGDVAPVSREVLRQTEPDPERRPRIHLG
jgi:hypothetical protein